MGLLKNLFLSSIILILTFSVTIAREPKVIINCQRDDITCHANLIKSTMNFSASPCDNFFEYACGNHRNLEPNRYSNSIPIAADLYASSFALDEIAKDLVERMDLAESLNVTKELQVAQRFYNSCLEADLHHFPASDPNYLRLIRSIGGFPAVDDAAWNASNFNWVNMSAYLTNYGARGLFVEVPVYWTKPYLKPADLGFDIIVQPDNINSSRAYKVNEKRMRGYLRSFNLKKRKIAEVIDGIFAFWREALASMAINRTSSSDSEHFDENNYYRIVWNQDETPWSRDNRFTELHKVCARHTEAVANYLAMRLLYTFDAKLNDIRYQRDYCASRIRTAMSELFTKLYYAEHFPDEKGLQVTEVLQNLYKSNKKLVEKVDWLDSDTRQKFLTMKHRAETTFRIINGTYFVDRQNQKILGLQLVDDDYAANNINFQRLRIEIGRITARHSMDDLNYINSQEQQFGMMQSHSGDTANATLYLFPAALHPPLYLNPWARSLKFGTFGFCVASELNKVTFIRSFPKVEPLYKERSECLAGNYRKHAGTSRNLELFYNSLGLRVAFEAHRSYREQLLQDPEQNQNITSPDEMPGLDLSPDQLFFLGYTQMFCVSKKKEAKYWALDALANNEDFHKVFNCPVGSGMRPTAKTCSLL